MDFIVTDGKLKMTTKTVTYTRKEKNATAPFMCVVCQKSAEGRKGSKFCSNTCKQRDKNLRAKTTKT
jgi:predicted nucleic acid-binding Zn ribbon protein